MKKIKVQLADRRWLRDIRPKQSVMRWRGTAFVDDAMHSTPGEFAKWLPQSGEDAVMWAKGISRLNGFFALIWQSEEQAIAIVDRVRSIPLFYGINSDAYLISDDAEWVRREAGDGNMDPIAREEFQLTGYVTGKETLYPNVKQLQAGELVIVDAKVVPASIETHRYYRFLHTEPTTYDEDLMRQRLENSAIASIKRLIEYASGRQVVIPLSGGYDSRLITTLLSRLGYKNILAFSYGMKGSKESTYSRKVARALGVRWHFVEYSTERWRNAWNTGEREKYQKWAGSWSSVAHVQDWVAVRTLHNDGALAKDCIFVPGHTGDFVSGGHIPNEAFQDADVSIDTVVETILQRHYSRATGIHGPRARCCIWKDRVIDRAEVGNISQQIKLANAFEKWEWQERQAKFIVNSVRVYEFFGYDWWLPLWDGEFVEFWQGVPLRLRQNRRLYLNFVKCAYASQIGINVERTLGNASDLGFLGRCARSIVGRFAPSVKEHCKVLRHRLAPFWITNEYFIARLARGDVIMDNLASQKVDGVGARNCATEGAEEVTAPFDDAGRR
jgi:asparagine synthase (glutamine-hydrolysing)